MSGMRGIEASMSRAFSPLKKWDAVPGALPQAGMERAVGASNATTRGFLAIRLLVLGGFDQGVGAADHFVQGGAGGDHGVDAVFFFYLEVDEERLA